mmetsp:Transcript_37811/g.96650  ORF Transcript_37811/g.96650 Transcript_37811/m.96650 type:complete len:385 (-) Transcript_37811:223-1377(-)
MTSLSESQAFLDQFDKCMPLCERGDAVTVINALHTLNSITQASIAQAMELKEGKDFVCSFLLELELALELYLSPSRKLGTIDGGLPALYTVTEEEAEQLANVPSHATKAKVAKFLEALGVAPSAEFATRSVADTVLLFLNNKAKPAHDKPARKHSASKRNISWADQCSSGSESDSDCSLPPLEDEDDSESQDGISPLASYSASFESSVDAEEEEVEEEAEEQDTLIDAAATLFLAPAPAIGHVDAPTAAPHEAASRSTASTPASHQQKACTRSTRTEFAFIKTRLCNNWMTGSCRFGDKCNFAHGESELRSADAAMLAFSSQGAGAPAPAPRGGGSRGEGPPANFKTRMCKNFVQNGYCQYKNNCAFAHGAAELRKDPSARGSH